jgi:MFS family permease
MASKLDPVSPWLGRSGQLWFSVYAALTAFCLYTCVFAFRKTFSVATFEGLAYVGVSYKVWLVIFQVLGYAAAKFVGIRVIAELKPSARYRGILWMTGIGGVSWLFFAIVPPPWNIIFLATNGFPLGMVWGMVFGYLEGRRVTEVLGAGLSVSFIFSSGLCKSIGGYLMRDWNVSEMWMPFVTCCLFFIPLVVFLALLDKIPPPSQADVESRTERHPMNYESRVAFWRKFAPGIVLFVLAYMLLTIFREFRENFSAEVWKTLGYGNSPKVFTATETPVSILVLAVMGSLMFIRNNFRAFMVNHGIILLGMIMIGVSTALFQAGLLPATVWMILIGVGLYLGYVPFNSIFFDRMIAAFHYVGTVGFIMYVADSFGYLGSIAVLLFREFGYKEVGWLEIFIGGGYVVSIAGAVLIGASMIYFAGKHRKESFKVKS